jgi:phage tail protein X
MFGPTSRYAAVEDAELAVTLEDGGTRTIAYKRRRFLPPVATGATVAAHRVAAGDRLDVLAYRYLGDATGFWRICDANPVVRPRDLVAEPGTILRVALPEMGP